MSDLIDRNDAIEAIEFKKVYITAYKGSSNGYVSEGNPFKQYNKGLDDAIKAVNSLAPAELERKKGKWIDHPCMNPQCSECGHYFPLGDFIDSPFEINFCPHCGADMRGEE